MAFSIYDFSTLTQWIHDGLSAHLSAGLTLTIEWVIIGVCVLLFVALFGLALFILSVKFVLFSSSGLGQTGLGPGAYSRR